MSTLTQQPPAGLGTPPNGSRPRTPPPASKAIPTDFRSSLAAWWNNSSYREARLAEERLLRRMSMYQPPEPGSPAAASKGWFNFGTGASADPATAPTNNTSETGAAVEGQVNTVSSTESGVGDRAGEKVVNEDHTVQPVNLPGTSLVATLRNVFIPTPDPSLAPSHPADPYHAIPTSPTGSAASSVASFDEQGNKKTKLRNPLNGKKGGKEGKLVDYLNTLEISNPEHGNSKEAVVVLHGYAAALG